MAKLGRAGTAAGRGASTCDWVGGGAGCAGWGGTGAGCCCTCGCCCGGTGDGGACFRISSIVCLSIVGGLIVGFASIFGRNFGVSMYVNSSLSSFVVLSTTGGTQTYLGSRNRAARIA